MLFLSERSRRRIPIFFNFYHQNSCQHYSGHSHRGPTYRQDFVCQLQAELCLQCLHTPQAVSPLSIPLHCQCLLVFSLSNENVSSVYDDRLDKIDPEGTLVPGQRRYITHQAVSYRVLTAVAGTLGPARAGHLPETPHPTPMRPRLARRLEDPRRLNSWPRCHCSHR